MTPSMPAASSDAHIETQIYERLGQAFEQAGMSQTAETEPAQTQEPEPKSAPEETSVEAQTGENDADATAQAPEEQTTEAEVNPYEDTDETPWKLDEMLKHPRGREIYAGFKAFKELSKPTAEGGIGHAPSVQDIRAYFDSHRAEAAMKADYLSGDPERVGKFLAHWFGAGQNGQLRPSGQRALSMLEGALHSSGPEAYGQIASPVMERYRDSLIGKWRAEQDPAMKDAMYKTAQLLNFDLYGEWLPKDQFHGTAPQQTGRTDGERAQIQSEWQKLNAAKHQQQQEYQQRWSNALSTQQNDALGAEVDKAIGKPLEATKKASPKQYDLAKRELASDVMSALQSNPEVWQLYQIRIEDARRSGDPAALSDVIKHFVSLATPVIQSKRAEFLKSLGVTIRQQNSDRHAQLRQVASHAAPANNGAPPQKSIIPNSEKKPDESMEEYQERRIAALFAK